MKYGFLFVFINSELWFKYILYFEIKVNDNTKYCGQKENYEYYLVFYEVIFNNFICVFYNV